MCIFTRSIPIFATLLTIHTFAVEAEKNDIALTAEVSAGNILTLDLGSGVKMELVLIKPGTFQMGSPEGEKGRAADEKQHTVTIRKAFYMAKFPVTQEQYEAVINTNPSDFKKEKGGSPKHPVEQVSWNDAVEFCEKLDAIVNAKLPRGMKLQLPTEAQWEYGCRAGTKTQFNTGDNEEDLARAGWYTNNSDFTLHPVGQKVPNAFGLFDMHGNVFQWCQDAYVSEYEKLSVNDPLNAQGVYRVLRGGSWRSGYMRCRSAFRIHLSPAARGSHFGFRVVVGPTPKTP